MGLSVHPKRVNDPGSEPDDMRPLQEMVQACIQCGTCTGSCPNAFAMDHTPRQLWRMVAMGREAEIFHSRTFSLCSACYTCTLRCPRGLALTDAMSGLKQEAARRGLAKYRSSSLFYQKFIESVRRHGRLREMEFMALYFSAMKSPMLPFQFAVLGLKLVARGKVALELPSRGKRPLETLFRKVKELEDGP